MDTFIIWLNEQRSIIHLLLHVLVPWLIAWWVAADNKVRFAFFVMLGTMAVDVDHLLATPIYQPDRCSILFHPLHQSWAFIIYGLMLGWPLLVRGLKKKLQQWEVVMGWLGAGLVIHMILDGFDCWWMSF